jgi:L-threonylcarbamoyladenylate synthase
MEFSADIEQCLRILQQGGLILYPTDTIWGIGCDATREDAVDRIFALKQRPETKSLIVLMADQREILRYVSQLDLRVFDFLQTIAKPTTVIYPGAVHLASNLMAEDGSIGIRLVEDPFCLQLIKRFRKPIVSTSANLSGQPAPSIFQEVPRAIREGVDYVVSYRQDNQVPREPSAVVKMNADGTVTCIRS